MQKNKKLFYLAFLFGAFFFSPSLVEAGPNDCSDPGNRCIAPGGRGCNAATEERKPDGDASCSATTPFCCQSKVATCDAPSACKVAAGSNCPGLNEVNQGQKNCAAGQVCCTPPSNAPTPVACTGAGESCKNTCAPTDDIIGVCGGASSQSCCKPKPPCAAPNSCISGGACPTGQVPAGTCGSGQVCCTSANTANPSGLLNYTLLEKVPGTENLQGSDLKAYLEAIYRVALILVTLSAVFMISVGGFMYLTSAGNTSQMDSAKSVIFDSLIGLVIALLAWLVLYVINPDLANPRVPILSDTSYTATTPGPVRPDIVQPGDRYTHSEAAATLSAAGIGITSSGNCSDQNNRNCTSLEGIPKSTITKVIQLKQSSGCAFSVTGGTEVGHKSHASGRPIVDVQNPPCLKSFLQAKKSAGTLTSGHGITSICAPRSDQEVAYACSYIEPKPHFHLVFTL